ncbi:MAG TPA: hypothetical protein IAB61_03085 [Candidatus Merdisoma merdipullorum]|nr:hypothetical protein [Candidatus Merdisoma merdipullorum]
MPRTTKYSFVRTNQNSPQESGFKSPGSWGFSLKMLVEDVNNEYDSFYFYLRMGEE